MTSNWTTTASHATNTPSAVVTLTPNGDGIAFPAAAVLTQENPAGKTREVLGFVTPNGSVVPLDQITGEVSEVLTVNLSRVQATYDAATVRRFAASVHGALQDSPKTSTELARTVGRGHLMTAAALLLLTREGLARRDGELWTLTPTAEPKTAEPTPPRDDVDRIWRD